MRARQSMFRLASAVLWLAPFTYATECYFTESLNLTYIGDPATNFQSIYIYSQEDLDTRAANCTTLVGSLYIASNYTGPLVLRGITNITGNIVTFNGGTVNYAIKNYLTSVEMPDLLSISNIFMNTGRPIELVSFPKLEISSVIDIKSNFVAPNISFPALINAEQVYVRGNTTAMNFNSLRNVSLLLVNVNPNDYWSSTAIVASEPIDISFPQLRSVGTLSFVGNITSVNVPLLEVTKPSDRLPWYMSGFNIANSGRMLNVTAPKLWNTTVVRLSGGIGSFSFPSLLNLDGDLIVETSVPMNISIAPLQTAANVILTGNITGYGLSSLKDLKYAITINSVLPTIDCAPAKSLYANISHNVSITNNHSPNTLYGVTCDDATVYEYHAPKKTLSGEAKLGIGLAVGISGLILLCGWHCRREQKQAEKKKKKLLLLLPPPSPQNEHDERRVVRRQSEDVDGERLPGNQPRGAPGTIVADGGPVVGSEAVEPPGYTTHFHEALPSTSEEPVGRISDTSRRDKVRRE